MRIKSLRLQLCLNFKLITIILFITSLSATGQKYPSFNAKYSSSNGTIRFFSHDHVNVSDGTLILGECSNIYSEASNMMIMKIDTAGNVMWSKEITPSLEMDNYKICSMSDGSIIVAENNPENDQAVYSEIFLFKLTSTGNLVWSKIVNLDPSVQLANNSFTLVNMSEGANKDLLLSVMNIQGSAVIGRVDSTGALIWSKTFNSDANSYTNNAQCFYANGKVIVLGLKNLYNNSVIYNKDFFAMELNYADGSVALLKGYHALEFSTGGYGVALAGDNIEFNATLLTDNTFALSGQFYNFNSTTFYLYKIILDNTLSYISSETFASPLPPNGDGPNYYKASVFPNGKINIIGYDPYSAQNVNWYTADSGYNTIREMYVPYNVDYVDMDFKVSQNGENGYSLVSSYGNNSGPFYIGLAAAADTDTVIKNCLGKDTSFITLQSWPVTGESWSWDSITNNEMVVLSDTATVSDISVTPQILCSNSTVPLTLISFDAVLHNNNEGILQWTTTNEINASKIIVERSTNGINFLPLSAMAAKDLSGINNYQYLDENIPDTINVIYYRLQFVNDDGSKNYSQVIALSLSRNTGSGTIKIIPNPAINYVQVNVASNTNGAGVLKISDMAGRIVLTRNINIAAGQNSILINDISNLSKGLYNVQLINNEGVFNSTFLKE